MSSSAAKELRKHIRFEPDPLDYAAIQIELGSEEFKPETIGLIIDEAPMGGCGLVVLSRAGEFKQNQKVRIRLGKMEPLPAEIVWVSSKDEEVTKIGCRFLE